VPAEAQELRATYRAFRRPVEAVKAVLADTPPKGATRTTVTDQNEGLTRHRGGPVKEKRWLDCNDPQKMLDFLHIRGSYRQRRLFACACVRRVWHLLIDSSSQLAVEAAELYADGALSHQELESAYQDADVTARLLSLYADQSRLGKMTRREWVRAFRFWIAVAAAAQTATDFWLADVAKSTEETSGNSWQRECERRFQADLLRDVFGNPFRPVAFDPTVRNWNGGCAVALATEMYTSRDFSKAPLLADMLEDAGVTDAQMLHHLRSPGYHLRGCFAVDLVLGRE
jgi:hypothetical protein